MKPGRQSGMAAVEFALVLPILLIAVFGITELGRAFYQYNALVKATRDAGRYLAQQDLANPPGEASSKRDKAILVAVCGAPDCDDPMPPRFPGLTLEQAKAKVTLCDYLNCEATHKNVSTGKGTVDLVTVTIGGPGKVVTFESLVQPAEPFGWGIPDIPFAPIKTTMASRYF